MAEDTIDHKNSKKTKAAERDKHKEKDSFKQIVNQFKKLFDHKIQFTEEDADTDRQHQSGTLTKKRCNESTGIPTKTNSTLALNKASHRHNGKSKQFSELFQNM